jgi:hypothetical protein
MSVTTKMMASQVTAERTEAPVRTAMKYDPIQATNTKVTPKKTIDQTLCRETAAIAYPPQPNRFG